MSGPRDVAGAVAFLGIGLMGGAGLARCLETLGIAPMQSRMVMVLVGMILFVGSFVATCMIDAREKRS